ncbi:MAG: hypothetical protein ACE5FS_05030 [Paracoccaceae bacterium]
MDGLTERLLSTYLNVRAAMRREIDAWHNEGQLLVYLLLACLLWFVAGVPFAMRSGPGGDTLPIFEVVTGSRLLIYFVLLPLILYLLAALSRVISRIFGGSGDFNNARLALFWAFLSAAPAILAISLIGALGVILFGLPVAVVWLVLFLAEFSLVIGLWAACLAEAEDFDSEARVSVFMLAPVMLGPLLHMTI